MKRLLFAFPFVLAPALTAQKQASTLELLTRRASLVFEARVGQVRQQRGELLVSFEPLATHRGQVPAARVLREPEHRHCGCALHGLEPGQEIVIFADVVGDRVVPRGGSRGIVPAGGGVRPAIRQLLDTREPEARVRVLAAQLEHPHPRVREDAALALPTLRELGRADAASRARIRVALARSLGAEDPGLAGLLLAEARLDPRRAAQSAWQLVAESRRGFAGIARHVLLAELPPGTALATAPARFPATSEGRKRIAEVLAATGDAGARPLLLRLAEDRDPRVRHEALVGMLGLGADPGQLAERAGKAAVENAAREARRRSSRRRRFRAIRPHGG